MDNFTVAYQKPFQTTDLLWDILGRNYKKLENRERNA